MRIFSELNAQMISSSRLKWALLATPIVVGSAGVCLYYYYNRSGQSAEERAAAEKKAAHLKKLVS